jgi:hypothetical protein
VIRLQAMPVIPLTLSPGSSVPRPPTSAIAVRPRPAPQSVDEALAKPQLRLHAVDVVCADTGFDQSVHRLSASVSIIGRGAVTIVWPDAVDPAAITFNDERLAIPSGKTKRIVMPVDQRHSHGTLRCVWLKEGVASDPRPSIPRIEVDGRAIAPETLSWSIVAPPGIAVTAPSPPVVRSAAALGPTPTADDRLPYAASFREGTVNTWTIVSGAEITGLKWMTDSAGVFGPIWRTATLAALAGMALLVRWRMNELAWPELLATLALAGWIATSAGFWFAPLAFAIVVRATQIISTRQVVPQ